MTPKNCNECKYHNNCNSYYGGLGCRYKITPLFATLALVLVMGTTVAGAEDNTVDNTEVITVEAEDVGIHTIPSEPEGVDADTHTYEYEYEDVDTPEDTPDPEPEIPEGYVSGYEEGTYFEPNTYDEETDEYYYSCPDDSHVYAYSVYVDDDSYIFEEWCTICGCGTETPITDEEFEAMGINTCEEYRYD